MTESAISQEGLQALLGSMSNSVSKTKIEQTLKKAQAVNVADKNMMYHNLLDMIDGQNPREAAKVVLEEISNLWSSKLEAISEQLLDDQAVSSNTTTAMAGKSSIFRRVG